MKNYYYINKKNLQIETTTNDSNIDKFNNDLIFFKKITQNTQNTQKHPYHLVDPSPWPFFHLGVYFINIGGRKLFHFFIKGLHYLKWFYITIMVLSVWWRDVIREGTLHSIIPNCTKKFTFGMVLFIVSEAYFSLHFFGHFFIQVSTKSCIGCIWPPAQ